MKPPKLPVPPLAQTLSNYLRALTPLVSPEQLQNTKRIVDDFSAPHAIGSRLQTFLLKKHAEHDNWAQDYFQRSIYLKNRNSIPYLQNAVGILSEKQFSNANGMAGWAASAICATFHHKTLIKRKQWPPLERWRGRVLCMAQHENMLRNYRLPQLACDQHLLSNQHQSSQHVILIHRNQLYCLPLHEDHTEESTVARSILSVLEHATVQQLPAVGLLTALNRDQWATARDQLKTDELNAKNLNLIENCMMVVCLDESTTLQEHVEECGQNIQSGMHQMFHGGGSMKNSGNRWFDKDVQLVISKDGLAGAIMEHSFMDGTAMVMLPRIWASLNNRSSADHRDEIHVGNLAEDVFRLEWKLTRNVMQLIAESGQFMNRMSNSLDYSIVNFKGFGKNWLKSINCSPDAFLQLALQLAIFKVHGKFLNNYTSAHLRLFRYGRTETIRPLSNETVRWAEYFIANESNLHKDRRVVELFRLAIARVVEMTRAAGTGGGFDTHLMCLREAALEVTDTPPQLFLDDSYHIANHFHIVSSQVPKEIEHWYAAFPPDLDGGRGFFYSINSESIELSATCYKEQMSTNSADFLSVVIEVLEKMKLMTTSN